jgi:ASPIC and UnbV
VHFGLCTARLVERLTVRWPSGTVTERRGVRADQVLTVREP